MKKMKLLRNVADVMFWGNIGGLAFSMVMMFFSDHPIRSAGCVLICIGMIFGCANLEVWAKEQMLRIRDTEAAKVAYKETKKNRLAELYEEAS